MFIFFMKKKKNYQPVLAIIFNSVRSSDIRPKLRPEKSAENVKHTKININATHSGISLLCVPKIFQLSVPWCRYFSSSSEGWMPGLRFLAQMYSLEPIIGGGAQNSKSAEVGVTESCFA